MMGIAKIIEAKFASVSFDQPRSIGHSAIQIRPPHQHTPRPGTDLWAAIVRDIPLNVAFQHARLPSLGVQIQRGWPPR